MGGEDGGCGMEMGVQVKQGHGFHGDIEEIIVLIRRDHLTPIKEEIYAIFQMNINIKSVISNICNFLYNSEVPSAANDHFGSKTGFQSCR